MLYIAILLYMSYISILLYIAILPYCYRWQHPVTQVRPARHCVLFPTDTHSESIVSELSTLTNTYENVDVDVF